MRTDALRFTSVAVVACVHDVRTSFDVTTRKNVRPFSSARRKKEECNNFNEYRTEQREGKNKKKRTDAACQVRSTKKKIRKKRPSERKMSC